jgi:hypothetical protein
MASRFRIDLIEETSAVVLGKDTSEAPWLMLEWLDILNLDQEHITGLSTFNLERSGEVMDSCEINILHIICRVIVANLATGPVHTLDLDDLSVLDGAIEGHIRMPSIVEAWLFPRGLLQVDLQSCPNFSGHLAGDAYDFPGETWDRFVKKSTEVSRNCRR